MAQAKLQKSLFGGFSDPGYITTNADSTKTDQFEHLEPIPSRYLGKNMMTRVAPSGTGPDVYFDKKYATLAAADRNGKGNQAVDKYEDPGRADRKAATESKKKNIDTKDFKMASGTKKSTGPGSYYGTFQEKKPFPHEPDYKVTPKDTAPEKPKPQPPNIKTMPAKKGTYGMLGTTFSKIAPGKVNDEYDSLRKQELKLKEESKKKALGGNFKISATFKKTFDEKPGSGVSAVYDHFEARESKEKKAKKPAKAADASKKADLPPFKYSSPPKSGHQGYLNGFPNTRLDDKPDPYDAGRLKKDDTDKKGKKGASAEPKPLAGAWKPVSGPKEGVVRSLLKRYY